MGAVYERLDERLRAVLAAQHVFFVATAPTGDGHVNVSPKGYAETFTVLDDRTVAYLDLTGSGVETVAHLRENGRITLMFCAFEGPPRIIRLYGRGEVVEPGDDGFGALVGRFPRLPGVRSAIVVRLTRIADSCGFGVPRYTYAGDRDLLVEHARRKGERRLATYRRRHNERSLDGLPGLPSLATGPE